VYLISKGQLKMANKKFSTLNAAYEINLGFDSMVQLSTDDGSALPKIRYTFVPIAEVADKPTNAVIDVIGVVTDVSPVQKCAQSPASPPHARTRARLPALSVVGARRRSQHHDQGGA